tara:strand:+ start:810 stop:1361 length:552 start_codon:yes stop_codon:yes gene_type:complete
MMPKPPPKPKKKPKPRRAVFPELRDVGWMTEMEDLTHEELAAEVGCHPRTVQDARGRLRLASGKSDHWCKAEEEALRRFYVQVPAKLLGEALGRGMDGVYFHAKTMGLKKNGRGDVEGFWDHWREWLVDRFPAWRETGDWVFALNFRWRPPMVRDSLGCGECEMTGCSGMLPCEYIFVGDMIV